MLTEVCADLHNYFCTEADKHSGEFTISGGTIAPLDFLQEGQYFRIIGSVLNDGVYKYPASGLIDEASFHGAVWAMSVPPKLVALCAEIQEYQSSDAGKPSGFTSESFGGYSYSRPENSSWQAVFYSRLNQWRKIR